MITSWSGIGGIVSLAAALALPPAFLYCDVIVLTAFSVVLGTLVIQGLTLLDRRQDPASAPARSPIMK
jgi:monovalent cation/hydrogen antiporter